MWNFLHRTYYPSLGPNPPSAHSIGYGDNQSGQTIKGQFITKLNCLFRLLADYIMWHIVSAHTALLPSRFQGEEADSWTRALSGVDTLPQLWISCVGRTEGAFPYVHWSDVTLRTDSLLKRKKRCVFLLVMLQVYDDTLRLGCPYLRDVYITVK